MNFGKHDLLVKSGIKGLIASAVVIAVYTPNIASNLGALVVPSVIGFGAGMLLSVFLDKK